MGCHDGEKLLVDLRLSIELKSSYDLLKPSGSIYVCCTFHNINSVLNAMKKSKINIKHIITWYKTNSMPSITKRTFTHSSEFLIYGVKNSKWVFNYFELIVKNKP